MHVFRTNLRSKWRKVVTGDEKKRVRDLILESQDKPEYIKLFDKVAFTLGVLNICACQYFLLNLPEWFYLWYSVITPLILFSRFHHFKSLDWEYFMLDFCYFVSFCFFINLYFLHDIVWFTNVCFIYSFGPLLIAVVVWRNSLVFHDYDKLSTVYIHIIPSMVSYVSRFHGHMRCNRSGVFAVLFNHSLDIPASQICQKVTTITHLPALQWSDYGIAISGYIIWQLVYFYKTEVIDKPKLDKCPKKLTSLRWLSRDMKNPFVMNIIQLCRYMGVYTAHETPDPTSQKTKLVFVVCQFIYTLITFIPTYYLYESPFGSLFYIGIIFTLAVYNGASYYIEVFSTRYQWQFQRIKQASHISIHTEKSPNRLSFGSIGSSNSPRQYHLHPQRHITSPRSRLNSATSQHTPTRLGSIDETSVLNTENDIAEFSKRMSSLSAVSGDSRLSLDSDLHNVHRHELKSPTSIDHVEEEEEEEIDDVEIHHHHPRSSIIRTIHTTSKIPPPIRTTTAVEDDESKMINDLKVLQKIKDRNLIRTQSIDGMDDAYHDAAFASLLK